MRARWLAPAVVLLAGCGASEARDRLEQTSERLGALRSGEMTLRLVISALGSGSRADVGFELEGPFALAARRGRLPRTDLAHTEIAGPQRTTVAVVADGRRAWIRTGGRAYVLPPERTRRLRRAGTAGGAGDLETLRVDRWIDDAELTEGPRVDGVATDEITGRLRAAAALNDLFALGRRVGSGSGADADAIRGDAADALDEAGENASVTLHSGREDRLLRRLVLRVAFPLERSRELGGGVGKLRGAQVRFTLRIRRPNRPVRVRPPANALPFSALPRGG